MESFVAKHAEKISATLSCFDRVLLKGYLPFSHPRALEGFLNKHGILLNDFKTFAPSRPTVSRSRPVSWPTRPAAPFSTWPRARARTTWPARSPSAMASPPA